MVRPVGDTRMLFKAVKTFAGRRTGLIYLVAAGITLVGLVVVTIVEPYVAVHQIPRRVYVPVHTILEFLSITVSFAVFAIGWYAFRQTKNRRDLFIAVGYMAVGAIDFVHTLSYSGMPDFLGTNSVGKAAAYWLSARLVDGGVLLGAAFVSPTSRSRWIKPGLLVPAAAAVCLGLISLVSIGGKTASELLYRPDTGLTALKINLEWFVIALYASAIWAFSRARRWQESSVRLLQGALIFAIGSEICFTLYRNAYDAFNLLGHIYKVGAYYLVLQALFVSSLRRPYMELSRTKEQLQRSFAQIGEALAAGLSKGATLKQIAGLARQMFEADIAAISEQRQGMIEVTTYDGIDLGVIKVPLSEALASQALVSGGYLVVDDLRSHPEANPRVVSAGLRSLIAAPIQREGRLAGGIYIGSFERARFSTEDARILVGFAQHAAMALANAEHYEREHRIAEVLQEVIFPPPKLEFGGFDIIGKYEPAWDEARVGGDFYDYFDLGDGKLGIAIGDVSGKGLAAAVHTAIVKYSFQAYVREGFGPGEAVRRLDEVLRERSLQDQSIDSLFISLFSAILDTRTGRLVYCNAGHEPPVKISPAGEVKPLDPTGPILGLDANMPFEEAQTEMEPGDLLVLYTDGITEARAEGRLFGFDRLIATVQNCRQCQPGDIADQLYEHAKTHARGLLQDDVALIVVRRGREAT